MDSESVSGSKSEVESVGVKDSVLDEKFNEDARERAK